MGEKEEEELGGEGGVEVRKNALSHSQSCIQNDFMHPKWN